MGDRNGNDMAAANSWDWLESNSAGNSRQNLANEHDMTNSAPPQQPQPYQPQPYQPQAYQPQPYQSQQPQRTLYAAPSYRPQQPVVLQSQYYDQDTSMYEPQANFYQQPQPSAGYEMSPASTVSKRLSMKANTNNYALQIQQLQQQIKQNPSPTSTVPPQRSMFPVSDAPERPSVVSNGAYQPGQPASYQSKQDSSFIPSSSPYQHSLPTDVEVQVDATPPPPPPPKDVVPPPSLTYRASETKPLPLQPQYVGAGSGNPLVDDAESEMGELDFYSNPQSQTGSMITSEGDRRGGGTWQQEQPLIGRKTEAWGDQPRRMSDDEDGRLALQINAEDEQLKRDPTQNGTNNREDLPPVLSDPKVRKQLANMKSYRPYFLYTMTALQLGGVIWSFVMNWQMSGSVIQTQPEFNYLVGPSGGVLIRMGALWVPCMRNGTLDQTRPIVCPLPIDSDLGVGLCSLQHICGMGGFPTGVPNQWWRFFLPIFLHGGLVHFLLNMSLQTRLGFGMERDFGWWRTGCIYIIAGVGGCLFTANFSGLNLSVGASGAIYGLIACTLLDLIQNWKLVNNPYWELTKLVFQILLCFFIGTLPFIDNFAHFGGFIFGFVAGLIFLPQLHFGKWDRRRKLFFQIVAVPVLVVLIFLLAKGFVDGNTAEKCTWCKYINCIPGMPWCEQKWASNSAQTVQNGGK
ncbi:hypothetical protein HK102_008647 [Quaeritorhiza haematococci]|nr:hypothetical protein HK102_008647 [Quaeritorhiza haematococci]